MQYNQELIQLALREDLGTPYQDPTSAILFPDAQTAPATARIISKHHAPIILTGLQVAQEIITHLDKNAHIESAYQDGACIPPGACILTLHAKPQALLMAERTILNFLQHLIAIATFTAQFVAKVSATQLQILDTRKTLPGLRRLAKYAVQCGGGVNHRLGLYDAMMFKDTHLDLYGGITRALNHLATLSLPELPIIIEVRNIYELECILTHKIKHKISRILLDNMSPQELIACVALCKNKIPTEASGNLNLDNIATIAATGVDFASVGKLTHSAPHIDLSMQTNLSL